MSFRDIALPLIARGIPVIPVQPLEKRCLLPEWQQRCTTETGWIDFWELQDPTYNVGCVAKPNGIVILDCDVKGLAKRIAKETGQTWPPTLVVRSAGKGCYHIYLRQTDRSRALGNRSVPELFDLQQNDKYVVGPGSRITNGNTYDIMQDEPIADFPDWLADWIEAIAPKHKKAECELEPVVEDFHIEDFLAWYGIEWVIKGNWYNCYRECPAAGYQHEQSKAPGFFFDGQDFGFNCWATGCPGHGKSVGWIIKHLNEDHAPYPKRIWPERELDYKALGIEEADLPTEEADVDSPFLDKPIAIHFSGKTYTSNPPTGVVDADEISTLLGAEKVAEPSLSAKIAQLAASVPELAPHLAPAPAAKTESNKIWDMPTDCMYGWLGEKTLEMDVPIGYGYPAMLAMGAVRTLMFPENVRPTLYVALIGDIHTGKSQAIKRAQKAFHWTNTALPIIINKVPGSDRGLAKMLEDEDNLNATNHLLVQDELRQTLSKMNISNSGLAAVLCTLWDDDKAGSADKKGADNIFVRLSILGALKANSPEEFTATWGAETNAGLYDRFIYGLAPKWKYTVPAITPEDRVAQTVVVPALAYDMAHAWRDMFEDVDRKRMAEIALRIAVITAGMNEERTITRECMQAALNFMTWQEGIRNFYKPSHAEQDKESRCTEAIKNALQNYVDGEGNPKWVTWRRLYNNRNWCKFGAPTVNRIKKAMIDAGDIIEEKVKEVDEFDKEKLRATGRVCWAK